VVDVCPACHIVHVYAFVDAHALAGWSRRRPSTLEGGCTRRSEPMCPCPSQLPRGGPVLCKPPAPASYLGAPPTDVENQCVGRAALLSTLKYGPRRRRKACDPGRCKILAAGKRSADTPRRPLIWLNGGLTNYTVFPRNVMHAPHKGCHKVPSRFLGPR